MHNGWLNNYIIKQNFKDCVATKITIAAKHHGLGYTHLSHNCLIIDFPFLVILFNWNRNMITQNYKTAGKEKYRTYFAKMRKETRS